MGVDREQRELKKRGLKRCKGPCGEVKPRDHFLHRPRRIKDGTIRFYPVSECKLCAAQRVADYRQKLRDEGLYDAAVERWEGNRDREAQNAHHRDYYRMQGIVTGTVQNPRGPIKKYRGEDTSRGPFVDARPLVEFVEMHNPPLTEADLRLIARCDNGDQKLVGIPVVDRIFSSVGLQDQIHAFWPDLTHGLNLSHVDSDMIYAHERISPGTEAPAEAEYP